MIQVVLADDQELMLKGLGMILEHESDIQVVGRCRNGEEAIYACKSREEIVASIRHAKEGHTHVAPQVASKMIDMIGEAGKGASTKETGSIATLTRRELEICHYLAQGKNNGEIAQLLRISEGTVKNHMTKILDKTMLRDRTQLALYALRYRL